MIKNIIFDWSGTLCNDFMQIYKATMVIFEKYGVPKITPEKYKEENKLLYMEFYNKYIPKLTMKEQDKLFRNAIRMVGSPKLFSGVKDLLEWLYNKGYKMAVLSSSLTSEIKKEIKKSKIGMYFKKVLGDVYDKRKTINALLNSLNFKPKETMFVGDTAHDIETGKNAGVTTVAITWGYQTKERILEAKPDYVIEDISELKSILKSKAY